MPVKKFNYASLISPAVTVLIIFAGFQYTNGQKNQELQDTIRQVSECKVKIEKQEQVNKEIVSVLQDIKIELAEVKTELKFINKRILQ